MFFKKIYPFLENAFQFLCEHEFNVSREDWKKFCIANDVSLDDLKSAKLELLRQFHNTSNDSEQLKKIFCCDPFDEEIVKSLRNIWHERSEKQPEPFEQWYYEISIHLLQLDTNKPEPKTEVLNSSSISIFPENSINNQAHKSNQLKIIIIALIPLTFFCFILGIFVSNYIRQQSSNPSQSHTNSDPSLNNIPSPSFPLSTCGDPNQGGTNTWYPVFIDNSDANLFLVRRDYCGDAFRKCRKEKRITSIQVASFTNQDKAEQSAEIMRNKIGSGEVGQPSIR